MLKTNIEPVIDRILHVAIEVFAEYGFRDTTVREICNRANVNVASVNYYFRSKEGLYTQALAFAFDEANQLFPQDSILNKALAPEKRLSLFIDNFLHKLMDDSHLGLHSKLITREIADPTNALNGIIATAIAPQIALLKEIIQPLLGTITDETIAHRCLLSILGQCLMFKHSRSIIDHLYPELIADDLAIKNCAEHITQFSIIALTQIAHQPKKTS
ncbi:MAG: CerR family C-terminal domain-containing protein [Methylococcales bacterium]|jgi:AcrR family transcriptional regulator